MKIAVSRRIVQRSPVSKEGLIRCSSSHLQIGQIGCFSTHFLKHDRWNRWLHGILTPTNILSQHIGQTSL
ncbi:hypothetical protein AYI70_g6258 [Smittium culicis]|uniref:Uncharacterized protein n=1 Tax=Smittium culicis TaxID=133412 RepID=A0A1R1XQX8_9FUNG|nr:hypothetical protein AYI70_g6258 [Smittium culicis]